jgi:transposase
LAAYVPSIDQRCNEGCRNAAQIHRELQAQARQVSARTVSRYLTIFRTEGGVGHSFASVEPAATSTPRAPPPPSLTPRQAAIVFGKDLQRLTTRQQRHRDMLFAKDVALQPVYEQVQAFCRMVRTCGGHDLERWLQTVEQGSCPQVRAYAAGLRNDLDAERAGLTERYSQGPVEGHVHRIQLIKRSGYGRMGLPLLRQRVLLPRAS